MATLAARQRRLFVLERFERWLAFHHRFPRVYVMFRDLSRQAFRSGRKVGARCVWENIRWKRLVELPDDAADGFMLNDHYVPYYARLVMLRNPEMDGYFERRDARMDVDDATLLGEANAIDQRRDLLN